MGTFPVALLIFAAVLEHAFCLWCYTCDDPTQNCMTVTNCSVRTTACLTMMHPVDSDRGYPFFGIIAGTKSCAEKCALFDSDETDDCYPVSCCYTDLCNEAGPSQAAAGFSVMGFALVFALFGTTM
ncbi:ly6/PLAUR domain-containing protein 2-like [Sphaerodactylus townsendi]|uniref:ly6/PLAUR domain-containing protein 2-like n=1 Tax=Sphaerodactylus townsendi TaxID=933632 RepID=UPI002026642A|nr:ly6/PLAUR domain-containing protein 2-like [Sphaerodactylus townsendi]